MNSRGLNILSVDGKDLYLANHYIKDINTENRIGYNIRQRDGTLSVKKFTNVLDYSLDVIKLQEVYESVYRNGDFTFKQGEHEYISKVINVTFKYSNKIFNKIRNNIYVRFGYDLNDLTLIDHVCISEDEELIAIEINQDVEVAIPNALLGKSFYFDEGQYHAKANINTLNTVSDIRANLYDNGFYLDGVKYIRFKRSSGSSRVGKCLFIDEKLYMKMHKWEMNDIYIQDGQETDLAALEAYIALTLSSIIDTVEIQPKNILVIDDYESVFTDDVIETKLSKDGKSLFTAPAKVTIKNSIWDGQSLGDVSLFKNYSNYSMLLLRNRFFKSAMFKCKMQDWFRDNNITNVNQLNGFTLAEDISDIKLITTPSSIKYLKFGELEKWLNTLEPLFGIVKHEKPTHFFEGRMVSTHYQLLNSLQMSQKETEIFLKQHLDFIDTLYQEPSAIRYFIKYPEDVVIDTSPLFFKNDIVFKLMGLNEKFTKTKLYFDFRDDLIKSIVNKIRNGHIYVNGNYSTMLGNPIEMLQQSIGTFTGTSILGVGNIHSVRFEYDKTLLGSRSPHVCSGNILLTQNVQCELIDTYIPLSNEVVCINSINESILDRLSGSDFDSDTLMLTDNEYLIQAARKNYEIFKTPVNHVSSQKTKRKYTNAEKCDLDIKTSENLIGEIVNLSQELNSYMWDLINSGSTYDDVKEIYYDICQLDVMSGIEIDKAKKEFTINNADELKHISEKYKRIDDDGRKIKPNFFGHVARQKGYYDSKKKNYQFHETTMDYIQHCVNQFRLHSKHNKRIDMIPFQDILIKDGYQIKLVKYTQVKRVMDAIEKYSNETSSIFLLSGLSNYEKYMKVSECLHNLTEYIGSMKFSVSTMYYLLSFCDNKKGQGKKWKIMNGLFGYPNTSFYEMIIETKEDIPVLEPSTENDEIDVRLFDYTYKKVYKNTKK